MTDSSTRMARPAIVTIILCLLATVLEGIDIQAAGAVGPQVVAEYGLSQSVAGLFFSAGPFGLLLGALLGGWLGDRVGRKYALIGSVAVFGAFSLLTPFAPGAAILLALRLLTGFGLGGAMPNLIALVSESSPVRWRRSLTTALWVGTPIGGLLAARLAHDLPDWRWVFYAGGAGPLLLAPLMLRLLPAARPAKVSAEGPTPSLGRTIFAPGLATVLPLWTAYFCTVLLLHLLLNWLPILVIGQGHERALASLAAFWFNVGGCLGTLVFSAVLAFSPPARLTAAVYLGVTAGLFGLANIGPDSAQVLLMAFAAGTCVIGAPFILYGMTPELYPAAIRGAGVGAAVAAGRVGSVCGPIVVGLLLTAGLSAHAVLFSTIPLAVIAGISAVICFSRPARTT